MAARQYHLGHALLAIPAVVGLFILLESFPLTVQVCVMIPFKLVFGWIEYLKRALPMVHPLPGDLALFGAMTFTLVVGVHGSLRWLCGRMDLAPWRTGTTLRLIAIFFLSMFCGMAAIGIAHQSAWLAHSRRPMFVRSPIGASYQCAANLHQIGQAALAYAAEHQQRFPNSLPELLDGNHGLMPDELVCHGPEGDEGVDEPPPQTRPTPQESYLYFGKGHTTAEVDAVIALDPPEHHDDAGMRVLFGDGHVDWIDIDHAGPILTQHGFRRVEQPGEKK